MDDTSLPPLSFTAIEARIHEMPDGPIAALNTPRWAVALNLIGAGGAIIGLLPSLLMRVLPPQEWMAMLPLSGAAVMVGACALPFVRSVWMLVRQFSRPTKSIVEQMDHDREVMGELTRWLARYPKPAIADHLRFAQHMQVQMQSKVGLLVGGMDKLGIVPAAVSAAIVIQNAFANAQPPLWLLIVGIFLALLWVIGVLTSFARLRVQVFETLLAGAIRLQEAEQ